MRRIYDYLTVARRQKLKEDVKSKIRPIKII